MQSPRTGLQLPLLASLASRRRLAEGGEQNDEAKTAEKKEVNKKNTRKPKEKLKAKKGAPQEVSSRKAVAPPQGAAAKLGAKTAASRARDPRFDEMAGKLDMDAFAGAYSFLEEYRDEELQELKKQKAKLQKMQKKRRFNEEVSAAAAEQEEELHKEIKRRVQQDKQRKHLGEVQDAERALKGEEREKVRTTGKVPFFHKRGAVRKLVVQKKKEGKKGGTGRSKQEEKREKKLAAREKKRLPTRRVRE
eukprot:gb/GFBE01023938.1/.p1 GENE.gb/GFBE01023938.1/~~gb/GFBE01023938.1/.p1  ORF type:complete len:248 (+),score=88.37 gb/GFBE01023938.1/:1-744(+)